MAESNEDGGAVAFGIDFGSGRLVAAAARLAVAAVSLAEERHIGSDIENPRFMTSINFVSGHVCIFDHKQQRSVKK